MSRPSLWRPLFLTGMMGAGKSTVGKLMASRAAVVFVDLDRRIERVTGRGVATLIAGGVDVFRRWEHAALRSLVAEPGFTHLGSVVATGGGVVEDPRNLVLMRSAGAVAYLAVPIEILVQRLSRDTEQASRPLLDPGSLRESIVWRLAERESAYNTADLRVDGGQAPAQVVDRILAAVRERT
ncbi:MAG: shikimate kinase [Nannocystaceae bacterium]